MIQTLKLLFKAFLPPDSQHDKNLFREKFSKLFEQFDIKPEVLFSSSDVDFALLCGREMQAQRHKNHHDLVIELGHLAHKLNLSHERISINLRKSIQESSRQIKLSELEKKRLSEDFSKKDYESAVVKAWMSDPECSKYMDLLKKIITKKLKRDGIYCSASDDLKNELVELQVNRRILLELSSSEWKLVRSS